MSPPPTASTPIRNSMRPGGASNTTRWGPNAAGAAAVPARGGAPVVVRDAAVGVAAGGAAFASGTRPRNTRLPLAPEAESATRPGCSRRTPGVADSGSQTNVTRVWPFSPLAVPTHVRTYLDDCTDCAIEARACWTGLDAVGAAGADARTTSSAVAAQYPRRARTSMPGRLTRTLIS
jgi:hypothetical protein